MGVGVDDPPSGIVSDTNSPHELAAFAVSPSPGARYTKSWGAVYRLPLSSSLRRAYQRVPSRRDGTEDEGEGAKGRRGEGFEGMKGRD